MTSKDSEQPSVRLARHVERARDRWFHEHGRGFEPIVDGDEAGGTVAVWSLPWIVGVRLTENGDQGMLVEDVVLKWIGGPGVPSDVWQGPDLVNVLHQATSALSQFRESNDLLRKQLNDHQGHSEELFAAWATKSRKRGLAEYAALAAMYVRELEGGNSAPVAALARRLQLSSVTVAQRIREARKKKLLTAPLVGNTGGQLTALAVAHLTPGFPGVAALRAEGKSVQDISGTYGIPEDQVLQALADANALHLGGT